MCIYIYIYKCVCIYIYMYAAQGSLTGCQQGIKMLTGKGYITFFVGVKVYSVRNGKENETAI